MEDNPLQITSKILRKILLPADKKRSHKHNISKAILKDLPVQLYKPIGIYKQNDNGHIIVLTEHVIGKNPVICAIEINKTIDMKNNVKINSLRSLHDKHDYNFFEALRENKETLYEDKKKMDTLQAFLQRGGVNSVTIPSKNRISKFLNKSTPKPVYNGQNVRNKSFIVGITDITENNKAEKIDQLEKALNAMYAGIPFIINHVPADDSARYQDVELHFTGFDRERIEKAVQKTAFSLGVPLKSGSGEGFVFDAQKELTDKWYGILSGCIKAVYDFVTGYFDLPEINVMSKANLRYKGKRIYSPETGKPLSKSEWNTFVNALERFLNSRLAGTAEKIVLDATVLGRILDKLVKENSIDKVRKMRLDDVTYKGKNMNWISRDVKRIKNTFDLDSGETARIEMLTQSAAEKLTRATADMKSSVKQILIDGVIRHKGKSEVSQDLFDRLSGQNRDFMRIADTEIQRNFNQSYIAEEVHGADAAEKIYFKRVEVLDNKTCSYCRSMNGKVAIWSRTPLRSGAVKDDNADLAIWEGKEWDGKKLSRIADAPASIFHPYCRGVWLRYEPEIGKID